MRSYILFLGLGVCCAGPCAHAGGLRPGLAHVSFDDTGFQRPRGRGVDERIALATKEFHDFSKLWIGRIRFPVTGEVTFLAEADNGLRLFVGKKCVIDGWLRDGARQGGIRVTRGETLPLRVEYFQDGGAAYFRLYWQWEGHARELVPPSAFWHEEKDLKFTQAIVAREETVGPGNAPPVISVPTGKEEFKSSIYRPVVKATPRGAGAAKRRLSRGPHLFLDDFLIERSKGLERRVNCPRRDPRIRNPIITGKEDRCFQPYMTVVRDPKTGRFRIWYNARVDDRNMGRSHIGYMESEDGIRWARPPRILKDPAPIQSGVSVIDDGPDFPDPAKRYKLGWWRDGGLRTAASPDGLAWTPLVPYVVLRHNHDINNIVRDPLRRRYVAIVSVYTTGPTWKGRRRTTMMSVSQDLVSWSRPWYIITANDDVDEGQTQFYAMQGHLIRGDLWIGLVKVLRDDLVAPGTPKGAYGVGYTTLAWTRDGEQWVRDRTPFFEPDPKPGAWDHAHAWLDFQLPVGDEVYIYYAGYKNGHKVNRFEERQIGLVRMPRDRYVSRDAGADGGSLLTPPAVLAGRRMTVNADVSGELRVRLLDAKGKPIPGFDVEDCRPVKGDSVAHPIEWKTSLATLGDTPVQVEFLLRDARLYGFDLAE